VREWRWPRAGKIKFSHLQFETTVYDWQGAQMTPVRASNMIREAGQRRG
jgi:hypothetical protein